MYALTAALLQKSFPIDFVHANGNWQSFKVQTSLQWFWVAAQDGGITCKGVQNEHLFWNDSWTKKQVEIPNPPHNVNNAQSAYFAQILFFLF